MKRITREMPDEQKQAIAQSLLGRSLTPSHKANIAQALRKYWSTIPAKDDVIDTDNNENNENDYE